MAVQKQIQEKGSAVKMIKTQLAQFACSEASRKQGSFPSQYNKPSRQTLNAISLGCGASYEGPKNSLVDKIDRKEGVNDDELVVDVEWNPNVINGDNFVARSKEDKNRKSNDDFDIETDQFQGGNPLVLG
ncbi:hypothetical protein vseg_007995 [Gypsophila vaccaria]